MPIELLMWSAFLVANLLTGAAYFLIPLELRIWSRAVPHDESLRALVLGFAAVILSCGVHHLVMPFTHPHPVWLNVLVDVPMMLISLSMHFVLYRNRAEIVRYIQRKG